MTLYNRTFCILNCGVVLPLGGVELLLVVRTTVVVEEFWEIFVGILCTSAADLGLETFRLY